MRIERWARTVLLLAAAGASGCSGGDDDDDDDGELQAGTYTAAGATALVNTCDRLGDVTDMDGEALTIHAVTASAVTMSGTLIFSQYSNWDLARSGDTFSDSFDIEDDWTDPAVANTDYGLSRTYDCVATQTYQTVGTITGSQSFDMHEGVEYTSSSGDPAECIAAYSSALLITLPAWPCESSYSFGAEQ